MGSKEEEFYTACESGNLSKVIELLTTQNPNVNWEHSSNLGNHTALHAACLEEREDVLSYLVTMETIDINCGSDYSALHIGCDIGNESIVKILLSSKWIKVNLIDSEGRTPLFVACGDETRISVLRLLLRDRRTNLNQIIGGEARTVFSQVCCDGKAQIARVMLEDARLDVNQPDIYGQTPLWNACCDGNEEIVKILLAGGREIDTVRKTLSRRREEQDDRREEQDGWIFESSAVQIARKCGHGRLADLVEEYAKNPREIRLKLRNELSTFSFLFFC